MNDDDDLDMDEVLPCGHTPRQHAEKLPKALAALLNGQGATQLGALKLMVQAMDHPVGRNWEAVIQAVFFLVNSFDKAPDQLPPGCHTVDEARQQASAFALGGLMAVEQQIMAGDFPEKWLSPVPASATRH